MSETALWRFRLYTVAVLAIFVHSFPVLWLLMRHTAEVVLYVGAFMIPVGIFLAFLIRYIETGKAPKRAEFLPVFLENCRAFARSFIDLDVSVFGLTMTICLLYPQIDPRTVSAASAVMALSFLGFISVQIVEAMLMQAQPLKSETAQAAQA